ncbi:MAG: hypothetical protein AAFY07_14100 [Pseudomonadota bacterium]
MTEFSRELSLVAAAVIGINGCALEEENSSLPVIKVAPGDQVEAVFTPSLKEALDLQEPLSQYNVSVFRKHELQIVLGSETIKMTPGGRNLPSHFSVGVIRGLEVDRARIGAISSNFGLGRVSRREALDWARKTCETAKRGLNADSSFDPEQILSRNTNKFGREPLDETFDFAVTNIPLCRVKGEELSFSLHLWGPYDDADGVTPPDWDKEGYHIQVGAGFALDG